MKFVADLHIHSHFSRATSKQLNFERLSLWAQLKGVQVVGSGDLTHPGWLQEMKEKLEPAEEGLFKLKDQYFETIQKEVPKACKSDVRFILSGEISSIYKKNAKTRKIHNVVFLPSFEAVEKFQNTLEKIGNIRSDGRPILGLDAHDLLEIVLETDPQAYLIPAHIWTPWFSLFGSMSGFNAIEECFDDLTPHIFALETGLSSDPSMNWRLSALDGYTLVSNSDAHSPQKLAREANVFNTELSYPAIFKALKTGDQNNYLGTIEFFPEEGKYHFDGHRKCNIRWAPKTTLKNNCICPECGKKVTVGVMHRMEALADREEGEKPQHFHPFRSLIPLSEILGEVHRVGPNSKTVKRNYDLLLTKLGSELQILQEVTLEDLERVGGSLLAEGIRRMRCGQLNIAAGYDGEFGTIQLFEKGEKEVSTSQINFFGSNKKEAELDNQKAEKVEDSLQESINSPNVSEEMTLGFYGKPQIENQSLQKSSKPESYKTIAKEDGESVFLECLNDQQKQAVLCFNAPLVIVAGPGTGKTRTLTHRMAYLLAEKGIPPENLLAITFTNKAAEEMAIRLESLLDKDLVTRILIRTFHALGNKILRCDGQSLGISSNFSILSEKDQRTFFKELYPSYGDKEIQQFLEQISEAKNQLLALDSTEQFDKTPEFLEIYRNYNSELKTNQLLDFDDLIFLTVQLFESYPAIQKKYQDRFQWISFDEYQDINFAQYRLLRMLTSNTTNLCVIGDPDQAIYGFRGANRKYFLKFQEDFPDANTFHLSQNYRSFQNILDASKQVISKSSENIDSKLWSEFVSSTKLEIYQSPTYKAEAEYVVHQIEKMVGGTSYFSLDSGRINSDDEDLNHSFSDFAVLYRLHSQSVVLEEAFQRSGIPYQTVCQTPFFEQKEIRKILDFLWLIYNPDSKFLKNKVDKSHKDILSFLEKIKAVEKIQPVSDLIKQIYEFLSINLSDSSKDEIIKKLLSKAEPFENRLQEFLESTVLRKEMDDYDSRADRVTLMTLHSSKGLEFPVVFISGCEEGLIPYQRKGKIFDFEEERRLFYVGMTRAQEKLILSHSKSRFLFGEMNRNNPSRFLNDIEDALKELKKMAPRKPKEKKEEDPQLKLF